MSAPILWINGPFGVSRMQITTLLHQRLENSFVFEPQEMSRALNKLTPKAYDNEQSHPLWIPLMLDALQHSQKEAAGPVLVPVAVRDLQRHRRLMNGLKDRGLVVHHFTLMARPETIYSQLRKREGISLAEIALNTKVLESSQFAEHLDIESHSYTDLIAHIADQADLPLQEPTGGALRWLKEAFAPALSAIGAR